MAGYCEKSKDRYTNFRITFTIPFPLNVQKKVNLNGQTQEVCGITCGKVWTISRTDEGMELNLSATEQFSYDDDVAVVKPYFKNFQKMACRGRHITFDENNVVVVEIQRADARIVSFLTPSAPDLSKKSNKKRKGKPPARRQARKPRCHKGRRVKDSTSKTQVSSLLTTDAEDVLEDATGELVTEGVLNECQVNQLELETLPEVLPALSQDDWKIVDTLVCGPDV
ncbi:MAG: hypothetical protein GY826_05000, partial [Fuerstiella sp.]|nr:hypothetical protein [Fuerstiella sp.]